MSEQHNAVFVGAIVPSRSVGTAGSYLQLYTVCVFLRVCVCFSVSVCVCVCVPAGSSPFLSSSLVLHSSGLWSSSSPLGQNEAGWGRTGGRGVKGEEHEVLCGGVMLGGVGGYFWGGRRAKPGEDVSLRHRP